MLAHRGAVEQSRGELDVVAWSYYFLFSDRDRIATVLVAETLAFAAVAVVGTLLLFLHAVNVAVIAVGIAAIDGALFCVMFVWGVPLDAVAFICLAMAIGMSVDYVVHLSHAFEHHAGSPRERAQAAVCGIGASVLKGGTSTFLGIVVLGAATSEVTLALTLARTLTLTTDPDRGPCHLALALTLRNPDHWTPATWPWPWP